MTNQNAIESNKAMQSEKHHHEIVFLLKGISSILEGQSQAIIEMADEVSKIKQHLSVKDEIYLQHQEEEAKEGFTESLILNEMERIKEACRLEGIPVPSPEKLRERAIESLNDDIPF